MGVVLAVMPWNFPFWQVLRFAIKSKRLAVNPAEDIDLPTMIAGERQYLTHLEVMRLAMAVGRFRTLVFTLAYTGIRFGDRRQAQLQPCTTRSALNLRYASNDLFYVGNHTVCFLERAPRRHDVVENESAFVHRRKQIAS